MAETGEGEGDWEDAAEVPVKCMKRSAGERGSRRGFNNSVRSSSARS